MPWEGVADSGQAFTRSLCDEVRLERCASYFGRCPRVVQPTDGAVTQAMVPLLIHWGRSDIAW